MKTKTSIYHRHFAFTYVLLVVVFFSCGQIPVEYEYKQQIVKAKTIDLKDGNTRYNIAFTDGGSETFSFGLYSKYEVGDTICWRRENNWVWYVVDCQALVIRSSGS